MKNKIIYFVCLIAILAGGVYLLLQYNASVSGDETISCQSQNTVIHDDFRLNASYVFTLSKNKGEISISGLATEGEKQYQISRAIYFSYNKSDSIYVLQSHNIENFSPDESQGSNVNHHLPAFFYEPEKNLTIKIQEDRHHNKIISLYNIPIFYCRDK
ncbi:hypothetical protein [Klebsiella oxytoca]|uniref:hypothetical protein n=1 Tax=Klebsiella oxytoca TaxID=571 RepID=UPI00157B0EF6|nr:hypothetical protein [Klebsiella oxytoca]